MSRTISEELILLFAFEIIETMFQEKFAKDLHSILLSNVTIVHRIRDLDKNVQHQRFGNVHVKLFSVKMLCQILFDKATDNLTDALLSVYIRLEIYWPVYLRM